MVIGIMLPGSSLDHLRPTLPKTEALGPAMRAIKPQWRTFVILLWERQPISATEAYIQAGYTQNRGSAQVSASELLKDPRIKAAIIEYGRSYAAAFAPELHTILLGLARNPQHKDQSKVALAMLKHAGFVEVIEQSVKVDVNITRTEKIEFVRQQMIAEGRTPAQIEAELGTSAEHEITDAEFTEVQGDPWKDEVY